MFHSCSFNQHNTYLINTLSVLFCELVEQRLFFWVVLILCACFYRCIGVFEHFSRIECIFNSDRYSFTLSLSIDFTHTHTHTHVGCFSQWFFPTWTLNERERTTIHDDITLHEWQREVSYINKKQICLSNTFIDGAQIHFIHTYIVYSSFIYIEYNNICVVIRWLLVKIHSFRTIH